MYVRILKEAGPEIEIGCVRSLLRICLGVNIYERRARGWIEQRKKFICHALPEKPSANPLEPLGLG